MDCPAATQLFTPDWIVKYMVENSIGRLWLNKHPNDDLKREILNDIQKIFDGEITVEDLLQKYEITLENSSNIELIKKHL